MARARESALPRRVRLCARSGHPGGGSLEKRPDAPRQHAEGQECSYPTLVFCCLGLVGYSRWRNLLSSRANPSGLWWGIQCDAFSTRTSRALGISRDNLSPSAMVCQGSCTPHKQSVGAPMSPCLSTSIVV